MSTWVRTWPGTARDAFANQIAGAFFGRQRQLRQGPLVGLDAAHARRARHMPHPRQAHQRLVEMHVATEGIAALPARRPRFPTPGLADGQGCSTAPSEV